MTTGNIVNAFSCSSSWLSCQATKKLESLKKDDERLTLKRSRKQSLQADRMTLCALMSLPSHDMVTSTKSSSNFKLPRAATMFRWKLFHLRQKCSLGIFSLFYILRNQYFCHLKRNIQYGALGFEQFSFYKYKCVRKQK